MVGQPGDHRAADRARACELRSRKCSRRSAAEYPGIRQRVLDDQGELRRHVNVFVDGQSVRHLDGLATQARADSEISILPAISGG